MKRTVSVIVIMAMLLASVLAIIPVSAAATGTAINTAEDFVNMSADGEYYLAKDITIDEMYGGEFHGAFDGKGKTITLSGAEGAFRAIADATVKNLKLAGSINKSDASVKYASLAKDAKDSTVIDVESSVKVTVGATNTIASASFSGLIGEVKGSVTIKNCKNTGDIAIKSTGDKTADRVGWAHNVGGMVGYVGDSAILYVDNCQNAGSISSLQTEANLGGMVGKVFNGSAYIRGCTNSAPISLDIQNLDASNNYCGVGGMIGSTRNKKENSYITVYGCTTTANAKISGSNCKEAHYGGMIGYSQIPHDITVSNCINNAPMEVVYFEDVWTGVAGMVGSFVAIGGDAWCDMPSGNQRILNCTNNGSIKTTKGEAGGMLGKTVWLKLDDGKLVIEGCNNTASITTTTSGIAGGMIAFVGRGNDTLSDITIKNSKNSGNISAAGEYAAGAVGRIAYRGTKYDFVIENFTNSGNMTSTKAPAGVVSEPQNPSKFFIKNCANTGTISGGHTANDPIVSIPKSGTKEATVIGCYFKSGTSLVSGATCNEATATSMVNAAITPALDKTDLNFQINLAKSLVSENYTSATWNSVKTALTAAETAKNATSQTDVVNAANALYTAINALEVAQADTSTLEALIAEAEEKKEEDYDILTFGVLADALFEAKAALVSKIPSEVLAATAALQAALDGLVEAEYDDDENNGGSNNGGDEDDDDDDGVTDGTTDGDATGGDDSGDSSDGKKKKKGCKSAITATAVVLSTVLALGAGVAFKKKED